jgi:hypothetical protein
LASDSHLSVHFVASLEDYHEGAAITSPPTIVKNLVITGGEYGIRGAITVADALARFRSGGPFGYRAPAAAPWAATGASRLAALGFRAYVPASIRAT